ncbi:MAG: EF-hand domain-containing protein [Gammaproteobacteria bacterium]
MRHTHETSAKRAALRPLVISIAVALSSWCATGFAGDKSHTDKPAYQSTAGHKVQHNEDYAASGDGHGGSKQGHATTMSKSGAGTPAGGSDAVWDFDRLDSDGDDRLSKQEFETYREQTADNRSDKAPAAPSGGAVPASPHQVEALREFDSLDENQDGYVSREEIKKAGKAYGKSG